MNPRRKSRNRRGMTVLLVLGVLSITLALSYAMLRSQATSAQLEGNLSRRDEARQAANTGITVALRMIHEADWAGVDTTILGTLAAGQSYEVRLQTGDAKLQSGDADYGEYPFRLTLISTGRAVDPADPLRTSTHEARAVVQLIRRRLASPAADVSPLENLTILHWSTSNATAQVPLHTEGDVRFHGQLDLCQQYPDTLDVRLRYLEDLESMRAEGQGDYRPFSGKLYLPYDDQNSDTLGALQNELNLDTEDLTPTNSAPLSHPGAVLAYRLYPGGAEYIVPVLQDLFGSAMQNVTVGPDPTTNPLGIFLSHEDIELNDNVTIEGTVIGYGSSPDIHIRGSNVQLLGVNLPAVEDATQPLQLPLAYVADDVRGYDDFACTIRGLVVAWDEFELHAGPDDVTWDMQGRVWARRVELRGRNSWQAVDWETLLQHYQDETGGSQYFPVWLDERHGLAVEPLLTIRPDSASVRYHWQDWNEPVYAPHPEDEGLRWDLIRWED